MTNLREGLNAFMSPENVEDLRERLRSIMKEHNYSMAKVARILDMVEPTVHGFIGKTRKDPKIETLLRFERFIIQMEGIRKLDE